MSDSDPGQPATDGQLSTCDLPFYKIYYDNILHWTSNSGAAMLTELGHTREMCEKESKLGRPDVKDAYS